MPNWTNKHQMSLMGKQDDFKKDDLIEFGKRQGIKKPEEIIELIVETVSCWRQTFAPTTDVPKSLKAEIEKSHRLF